MSPHTFFFLFIKEKGKLFKENLPLKGEVTNVIEFSGVKIVYEDTPN